MVSGRLFILVLALLVVCGLASADTIEATGVDWSRGEGVWLKENGSSTPTDAYFAGVINIIVTANDGKQYNRDTLCAQLFVDIHPGVTYNTTVVRPDQAPGRNLQIAAWLVDNELSAVTTAAQGAGLQLAIWDIVEDGGDGFDKGNVQASTTSGEETDPTVLSDAEAYEQLALGPLLQGPFQSSDLAFVYVNTTIPDGSPVQMLIGPVFPDGPQPAPEPSTSALGGVGLVALAYLALRKKTRYCPAGRSRNGVPAS